MIEIDDEFSIMGDSTIELPSYMNSLSQEKMDEIYYEELEDRIISCGLHNKSKTFILLDGGRNLLELDPALFFSHNFFNIISVKPIMDGAKIEVILPQFVIEADSKDVLDASIAITMSDLEIDMKS